MKSVIITSTIPHGLRLGSRVTLHDGTVMVATEATTHTVTVRRQQWHEAAWWRLRGWLQVSQARFAAWLAIRKARRS